MKRHISLFLFPFVLICSCVPSKKYYDLVNQDKKCQEELIFHKNASISNENKAKEYEEQYNFLLTSIEQLKKDTVELNEKYQSLQIQYDRMVLHNINIEKSLVSDKETRKKQTSILQNDLDSKNLELQRKEDALLGLEKDLKVKHNLLVDREKKVIELEEALARKDEGVKTLKSKIAAALRVYEDKGLTIVEKKGKIYISLDAKLFFKSGSTVVEEQGKKALIDLAKVLEKEKDMEFIVEGHTDSDKLASANHPKNNWELSVLRASSIVEILLANSKMLPEKIVAAGRSEFQPVDTKDKAKNRRIEIIIAPNLNALYQLIDKK
jgi:chemotaxis protein MotB